ncbi:hypothetical protein [Acanthopleuribacter pedis]|uniref:Uncharacterized protein n=1 Tax=Acanthopleuribacter pedis TaxID=442870 RepID=A0A8J7U3H9_9BACT|nr:hypothetical protein [Acanthopleuribacter pedis]MBO1319652.1 hypothetical protein [Acanthopleuribacter pedis]
MNLSFSSMPGAPFFANALFSLLTGATLLVLAPQAAVWLGLQHAAIPAVIGGSLLFFAGHILIALKRRKPIVAELVYFTVLDVVWVLASVVLLVAFPGTLSREGRFAVLAVGVVVEALATLQAWGLWRAFRRQTA